MSFVKDFFKEVTLFFDPLDGIAQNKEYLLDFFKSFGFNLSDDVLNTIHDDFLNLEATLTPLFEELIDTDSFEMQKVTTLTTKILTKTKEIVEKSSIQTFVKDDENFVLEIFDLLAYIYLTRRCFLLESVLSALGTIEKNEVLATATNGRQIDFVRINFNWYRLFEIINDTNNWAHNVYGWSGNLQGENSFSFNYANAIRQIDRVASATGLSLTDRKEIVDPIEKSKFLKNSGDEKVFETVIPILQQDLNNINEDGIPSFSNEAGLKIVPFGDLSNTEKLGLALTPYKIGDISGEHLLSNKLTLNISMDSQAIGGAYLTLTPDGINVIGDAAAHSQFEFLFNYRNEDRSPMTLIGEKQSTHFQTAAIMAKIGGSMDGNFYISAGLENINIVVDFSEDGVLGSLVSKSVSVNPGNIILYWKTERGVYFEGGTNIGFSIPVHHDFGLLSIQKFGISLAWNEHFTIKTFCSAKVKLGPLVLVTENIGVNLKTLASPDLDGLLGRYNIEFGFQSPDTYGIVIDTPVVTGGGFLDLDKEKDSYTGAVELTVKEKIALKAIGIITTNELPDGKKSYSLLLLITAEFSPLQLGFGFTLNGVGGLIGANRGMDLPAIRVGVQNKTLDHILFPEDPVANAPQIIASLDRIFPMAEGNYSFGLMALIGWGVPTLLEVELGLMVSFPSYDIAVIGKLTTTLPDKKAPVLILNVAFAGTLSFENKYFFFDARIEKTSRLLSYSLSGDMAVRILWGDNPNFVLSVGGFHPDFKIPQGLGLEKLERITLNLLADDNPRLLLKCYFAVTSNTVQFGATIDFFFKKSKFKVIGFFYFHALFQFSPFYFIVAIGAILDVKVKSKSVLTVSVEGSLEGPTPWKAKGKGKFKIWFVKVSVSFSKTWGNQKDTTLPDIAIYPQLEQALSDDRNWAALIPKNSTLVSLRNVDGDFPSQATQQNTLTIHPFGSLSLLQRVVPLDITIEKFGNQRPRDYKKFSISFETGGQTMDTKPLKDLFAPAQFFELTDDQKISKKAYANYNAGLANESDRLQSNFTREKVVEYEFKSLDSIQENETGHGLAYEPASQLLHWAKGSAIAQSSLGRKATLDHSALGKEIKYGEEEFVLVHQNDLSPLEGIEKASEFEIQTILNQIMVDSPEMEDKLIAIPAYELV